MDITCLCPSPCIDRHIFTDSIVFGSESYADRTYACIGGKGMNVACDIASYGADCLLVAVLPENSEYEAELVRRKIKYKAIYGEGTVRENITFHTKDGETRISERVANIGKKAAAELCRAVREAKDIVIMSGSVPDGVIEELSDALANSDAKIILDSKSFGKDAISRIKPFLVKPNAAEASEFANIQVRDVETAYEAAKKYTDCGVENVIVSMGKDGAVLLTADGGKYYRKALCEKAVSTVGAGDAMIGGFAAAYANGKPICECFELAAAFSACVCIKGGFVDAETVNRMLYGSKYTTVIWDFNGTILDDVSAGIASVNALLERRGIKKISNEDEYREKFGFPIIEYYKRIGFDFEKESYENAANEWVAEYNIRSENSGVREYVIPCLEAFRQAGIKQIILSATQSDMLKKQVEKLGISKYFDEILGNDDIYAYGKGDTAEKWVRKNGRLGTVLIGDTEHDAEVAATLGISCLLVTGGHQSRKTLEKCGVPVCEPDEVKDRIIK